MVAYLRTVLSQPAQAFRYLTPEGPPLDHVPENLELVLNLSAQTNSLRSNIQENICAYLSLYPTRRIH